MTYGPMAVKSAGWRSSPWQEGPPIPPPYKDFWTSLFLFFSAGTEMTSHGWVNGRPLRLDLKENFPTEREAELQRHRMDQFRTGNERK